MNKNRIAVFLVVILGAVYLGCGVHAVVRTVERKEVTSVNWAEEDPFFVMRETHRWIEEDK